MKYDAGFLMQCMLMRIKSRAAYIHLRKTKLLPLPSLPTLRRLISSLPCTFGFNKFALKAIKQALINKPASFRIGTLMWDEMAIETSIEFDAQKLKFEGFVDFGDLGVDVKAQLGKMADHALVYIFRPFRLQWIQPIAVFATKGAAPGDIIHDIMQRAIMALFHQGAVVKAVVCDGASTNKKAAELCNISSHATKLARHSFMNPALKDERIFFFFDVPHIIKCIRNNFLQHGDVQV